MNMDSSDSESLPYSLTDSDAGSLVESIGSFEIESRETPKPGASFRRPKKDKKLGPQFLQFSKDLPDVPVSAAWEYIRDHRNIANLARGRGVLAYFDYLEGDGATGSVYLANYALKFCEQLSLFPDSTDERYLIHKVEVRDENSHMYAARCVGGRYQKRYHLYFMFIKVLPHEVLGESSSTIMWRLQYELRDPSMPAPLESKTAYLAALDNVKERHPSMTRAQRPFINHAMSATMTKRLKVLRCREAREQQLSSDEQKSEDPSEQRRKSSVEVAVGENEDVPDDRRKQLPRGKTSVLWLGKDDGEIDRDGATSQRLRRKTRSQSLVDDEGPIDADGLKRQRRGRGGIQQAQARRKPGSSSNNS